MRKPRLLFIVFTALASACGVIAQTPPWDIVTPTQTEQKAYLDSLITDQKHHNNLIYPILLKSETTETDQREVCSGSTSGSASTPDGSTESYINLSSRSVCRQLSDIHNESVMGLPDPANNQIWLIFIACTEGYSRGQKATAIATLGYSAPFAHKHPCIMQEGPKLSVDLAKEKSGYFIYVGTTQQLGGKVKVSKYTVIETKVFRLESPANSKTLKTSTDK